MYNNEPINYFWRAEILRFVKGMQANWRCDEEPRGPALRAREAQLDGIPKRLLYGRHACQAASDQRTRRADVQELSQRETLGVGVHPRNDHAHPHHGRL